MCGIFGYVGEKEPLSSVISGLQLLEYRGYDSWGVAGLKKGKIVYFKKAGKISQIEQENLLTNISFNQVAIGHTRWATHGKPTNLNAHPHFDSNSAIAIVHNGIIENYSLLRNMLIKKGIKFTSETDTEVIAQLLAYNHRKNYLQALRGTLSQLKGSFAIALIHKNFSDQIIAASRESPLAIGFDDNKSEILLSSDPNAFSGRNLNVFYLKNDEIAFLKKGEITVYDHSNRLVRKKTERLDSAHIVQSKEGYEHFMLKEIHEQPVTIQKAMMGHMLENFGTAEFERINFSTKELMATRHILIIACGTSWHAGCIGAAMLEDKARIPTQAEIASELRFKNPLISDETLVIAISQSGETADTLAAVGEAKAKGAKILGICNVENSKLSRESDSCIFFKAGPEFSVCSTKAFTSQITVLSLFTLFMARLRHMGKEEGKQFLDELKRIPEKVRSVLENEKQIEELAKKYSKYENFFFLGRRYMYATCLEAALKLKEISYLNANGYPAGEMKHGPLALINKDLPVIAFCANRQTYDKMLNNLMEIKARDAPILAFATQKSKGIEEIANDIFWLPPTTDEFATFPSAVAAQLLAYYIAKERGTDIDHPRNLAKSVTVE